MERDFVHALQWSLWTLQMTSMDAWMCIWIDQSLAMCVYMWGAIEGYATAGRKRMTVHDNSSAQHAVDFAFEFFSTFHSSFWLFSFSQFSSLFATYIETSKTQQGLSRVKSNMDGHSCSSEIHPGDTLLWIEMCEKIFEFTESLLFILLSIRWPQWIWQMQPTLSKRWVPAIWSW